MSGRFDPGLHNFLRSRLVDGKVFAWIRKVRKSGKTAGTIGAVWTGVKSQFFCSGHSAFQKVLIHSNRGQVLFGTFLVYQIKDLISIIIAACTLAEFQLNSSLVRCCLHTDHVAWHQQNKQEQQCRPE